MQSYAELKGTRRGKALIVACGPSAYQLELIHPERLTVIGLNDCEYYLNKKHDEGQVLEALFVYDRPDKFGWRRQETIAKSRAKNIIFRDDPWMRLWMDIGPSARDRMIFVEGGPTWKTQPDLRNRLVIGKPSPYVAMNIAEHYGCTDIGIIGFDLLGHKWSNKANRDEIHKRFGALRDAMETRGIRLVNLSSVSIVECLPKVGYDDWCRGKA